MVFVKIASCLLIISLTGSYCWGRKISNCAVDLDSGKGIVDLSSLDNPSNPRKFTKDIWTYQFNPCSPISCDSSTDSAVCQTSSKYPPFDLGDQSTASFIETGTGLTIQYTNGPKTAKVACNCDTTESFTFITESPVNTYVMTFQSPCCCPNGCQSKPTTSNPPGPSGGGDGLSLGSVLLIIFFVSLAVYWIGGFVFLKFVKKQSGLQTLPNVEFWRGMPGNVKHGFGFVRAKLNKQPYEPF